MNFLARTATRLLLLAALIVPALLSAQTTEFFAGETASQSFTTNPGSFTYFYDDASAGTVSITSNAELIFFNNSTAAHATITHTSTTPLGFWHSATADSATFFNSGTMYFSATSTAGTAQITNSGSLYFIDSAAAESVVVINNQTTYFDNSATGNSATITNGTNGVIDVSGHNGGGVSLGEVAGGGFLYFGPANVTVGTLNTSTVFSGVIAELGGANNNPGGSFTKAGTGSLTLTGANTYSGGTTVTGGIISFNSAANFGSGPITLDGGTLAWLPGSTADISAQGIVLGPAGGTLSTSVAPLSTTLASAITGPGRLTIQGGYPLLYLTGTNTYAGGTYLEYGHLNIGDGGTTGSISGDVSLNSNVSLNFYRSDAVTFAGNISGTGHVMQLGGGTLTLTGANTYSGNTSISSPFGPTSTIIMGSASALGTGDVSLTGGKLDTAAYGFDLNRVQDTFGTGTLTGSGAFTYNSSNDKTLDTAILGTASLTKAGSGALTLGGASTYTGATTVDGGALLINGSHSGSDITVNAGGTLGGTGTIGGFTILQDGALLALGSSPGTLTFTNGLMFNDGASLDLKLGTLSDLIAVTGGSLIGSEGPDGITLNLLDAGGFAPATYTLFDFTGAALGDFDVTDFKVQSAISGYTYSLAFNGSSLQLTALGVAIPEPSTYAALFGAGALGLAIRLRRRTA